MALNWMVLCYITQPTKLFHSAVPLLLFLSHWSCTRNTFDQLGSNSHEALLQMTADDRFMVLLYYYYIIILKKLW